MTLDEMGSEVVYRYFKCYCGTALTTIIKAVSLVILQCVQTTCNISMSTRIRSTPADYGEFYQFRKIFCPSPPFVPQRTKKTCNYINTLRDLGSRPGTETPSDIVTPAQSPTTTTVSPPPPIALPPPPTLTALAPASPLLYSLLPPLSSRTRLGSLIPTRQKYNFSTGGVTARSCDRCSRQRPGRSFFSNDGDGDDVHDKEDDDKGAWTKKREEEAEADQNRLNTARWARGARKGAKGPPRIVSLFLISSFCLLGCCPLSMFHISVLSFPSLLFSLPPPHSARRHHYVCPLPSLSTIRGCVILLFSVRLDRPNVIDLVCGAMIRAPHMLLMFLFLIFYLWNWPPSL